MNLDPDAVTTNTYVAAIAGAIVSLRGIPGSTRREKFSILVSGFLMGIYAGPLAAEYMHAASPKAIAGVAFAVGAGGMVVFAAVIEGIKQTQFGAIISGWLSRNRSV